MISLLGIFSDRLVTAIPLLQRELDQLSDCSNLAYAFPDDGAYKRFHHHFKDDRTIICAKVRDGTSRTVTVKDGSCFS